MIQLRRSFPPRPMAGTPDTVSGPAIATATVGAVNVELSIEEARRMTDALSLLVGTADAADMEVVVCG